MLKIMLSFIALSELNGNFTVHCVIHALAHCVNSISNGIGIFLFFHFKYSFAYGSWLVVFILQNTSGLQQLHIADSGSIFMQYFSNYNLYFTLAVGRNDQNKSFVSFESISFSVTRLMDLRNVLHKSKPLLMAGGVK